MKTTEQQILRCSFCNKTHETVRKLIAGPNAFICDECVEVCRNIIADDDVPGERPASPTETDTGSKWPAARGVLCSLCRMPTSPSDALLVEARGVLCPKCVEEIEAAIAAIRESQ